MSQRTKLTERQRYWQAHIRRCEASGQTLAAYAAAHGLSVSALYESKSRLKRQGALPEKALVPAARFVRVERSGVAPPTTPIMCRVQLPNAVVVEVGCEAEHWESLLASVARLP